MEKERTHKPESERDPNPWCEYLGDPRPLQSTGHVALVCSTSLFKLKALVVPRNFKLCNPYVLTIFSMTQIHKSHWVSDTQIISNY